MYHHISLVGGQDRKTGIFESRKPMYMPAELSGVYMRKKAVGKDEAAQADHPDGRRDHKKQKSAEREAESIYQGDVNERKKKLQ